MTRVFTALAGATALACTVWAVVAPTVATLTSALA